MTAFDYAELEFYCEYEMPAEWGEVYGCGEHATHSVWWQEDGKDAMYVCQKHFEYIKKCEADEKKKVKCDFDYDGICGALRCHSQSECNARDEYGNPISKEPEPLASYYVPLDSEHGIIIEEVIR